MQQNEINELLHRYNTGAATAEEKALLESWYLQHRENNDSAEYTIAERLADAEIVWNALPADAKAARLINLWSRIAVAASVILCLSVGGYFLLPGNKKNAAQLAVNHPGNVIVPGSNKAILTLAGGKKISLSDARIGQLVRQEAAVINKTADGEVIYHTVATNRSTTMLYDTLSVPRAGHFQLVFADGSKAWLNAATVIRYPESFSGNSRQVELVKGEAYFEVVHNDNIPFKVITHSQVIEDIGTHFNVNAYDDEPDVKTTLLEGSVKVSKGAADVVLKPGQQSVIKESSPSIIVKKADLDEAIAWKNNHFIFNNESIQKIMRQISRWYDVDVSYKGDMSGKEFAGSVSRFENVSEVLRKLEETGTIHFKIEGRRIIVTP